MNSWENVGKSINQVLGGLFETIVKIQVASSNNLEATTAVVMKQPNHSKVREMLTEYHLARNYVRTLTFSIVCEEKLVLYIHACHM